VLKTDEPSAAMTVFGDAADKAFSVNFLLNSETFEAGWSALTECDSRVREREDKIYERFDDDGRGRDATAPEERNTTTEQIYQAFCAEESRWGKLPALLQLSLREKVVSVYKEIKGRYKGSLTEPVAYTCATCDKSVLYHHSGDARLSEDNSLHFECKKGRHTEPGTTSALTRAADFGWSDTADEALIAAIEKMESQVSDKQLGRVSHISSALKHATSSADHTYF
jgi:hypothetical protein